MEPKIRLKGFSAEWEETSLGKLSTNYKYGINAAAIPYDGKNKYLRITDIDESTRVFSQDYLTSPGTNLSCCNDYLLEDGDITFARTGASVGKSYIYHTSDGKVYFAGFLIRTRLNDCVDKDCVFYNTLTDQYAKYIRLVSQRSGQPGVNVEELKGYTFNLPFDKDEQKALGVFFQHLDSLIQSTAKKIESLKQVKAASLQSMFPQEGETVPRVRFKGFEGEWKQIVMSDVGYMTAGGTPSTFEDSYWNGDINWLQSGAVQNNIILPSAVERKITKEGLSNSAAHLVQKDSVLIAITGATCANIGYLTFNSTANQSVVSVEPYRGFDSKFVYQSLMINRNQILSFKGGSAQSGVTLSNLKKMSILCPDYQEQQKIGCFFFNIEEMIMQCMTRLEKLKQIKTACLDNMFV